MGDHMQLSESQVLRFAPHALPVYVDALAQGGAAFEQWGIVTPQRMARFLGQCGAETGYLTIMREKTTWTLEQMCELWPERFNNVLGRRKIAAVLKRCEDQNVSPAYDLANLAYSDRGDLGNQGGDDGWNFRGGNLLQGTGRAWFQTIGTAIGVDLVNNPDLIEDGPVGLLTALHTWGSHDLNRFADRGYDQTIGCAINVGNPFASRQPIGWKKRLEATRRAMEVLGISEPDQSELALGARGDRVLELQEKLQALNYHLGKADGVFGPETARQVASAKLDFKREVGGVVEAEEFVGSMTWDALAQMKPVEAGPERAMVGYTKRQQVATLIERGSTEVATADNIQKVGTGLTVSGIAYGAKEIGVLDAVSLQMSKIGMLKSSLVPVVDGIGWALKHWFWLLVIAFGVWMYRSGWGMIGARIKAFVTRANLSK